MADVANDRAGKDVEAGGAEAPLYDVTARKAHQWAMIALIALGFIVGDRGAAIPVALAGAIMLVGRFWWPADLVRQIVWRALEPWGILRRHDAVEDHETRRVARVLGGSVWLLAALLLIVGASVPAWVLAGLVAVMVVLDATVNFCALCFASAQLSQHRPARHA